MWCIYVCVSSVPPSVVLAYNEDMCSAARPVAVLRSPCLILNVMIAVDRPTNRIAPQRSVPECGLPDLLEK